jgi:hypothetical protein
MIGADCEDGSNGCTARTFPLAGTGNIVPCPRFAGRIAWKTSCMSIDSVPAKIFTYVVVMQGSEGPATMPVTVCARPGDAEQAARVIAWLELTVLGRPSDDDLFE